MLTGKLKMFSDACYDHISVDELNALILGGKADYHDCKRWNISKEEWLIAIINARDAILNSEITCQYCGYKIDDSLGKYGCPNCLPGTNRDIPMDKPDYSRQTRYKIKQKEKGILFREYALTLEEHKKLRAVADKIIAGRSNG